MVPNLSVGAPDMKSRVKHITLHDLEEPNSSSASQSRADEIEIPLNFGHWLNSLGKRVETQEREIAELKARLSKLEPVESPLSPAQFCERHRFKGGTPPFYQRPLEMWRSRAERTSPIHL